MDSRPKLLQSPLQEVSLQACVCMGQFLSQGSISLSLATMTIVQDYFAETGSTNDSQTVWYMGAYALTLGTFILISGRLGDLFGLRKMFVFGWFWCALWGLITGFSYFSHSSIMFIVCRAFMGIGFAFVIPNGVGIIGSVYPTGKRKNVAFSLFGAAAPIGACISGIMAAVVAEKWRWDGSFYVLAILCFLLGLLSMYAIPDPFNHNNYTLKEGLERFDLWGSIIGVVGMILFNFVWNQGPVVGWGTAYVIVLLVLSVLLLGLFFAYELFVAKHPLLPLSIFTVRIGLILACMALGWGLFGIWQYYYWTMMIELRNYTPINTALTYIPLLVVGMIAAITVGQIISRKTAPFIILAAMLGFFGGSLCLANLQIDQTFWRVSFGQMFLLSWGMDLSFPSSSIILSDFLPKENQGMGGSLVNTVVNYSVSLFLAIASTPDAQYKKNSGGNVLTGFRAGIWFGVGCVGTAVLIAVVLIFVEHNMHKHDNEKGEKEEISE